MLIYFYLFHLSHSTNGITNSGGVTGDAGSQNSDMNHRHALEKVTAAARRSRKLAGLCRMVSFG